MHFLQAINSDLSVLIVCNKTGGTINGDKKKIINYEMSWFTVSVTIHHLKEIWFIADSPTKKCRQITVASYLAATSLSF